MCVPLNVSCPDSCDATSAAPKNITSEACARVRLRLVGGMEQKRRVNNKGTGWQVEMGKERARKGRPVETGNERERGGTGGMMEWEMRMVCVQLKRGACREGKKYGRLGCQWHARLGGEKDGSLELMLCASPVVRSVCAVAIAGSRRCYCCWCYFCRAANAALREWLSYITAQNTVSIDRPTDRPKTLVALCHSVARTHGSSCFTGYRGEKTHRE